MKTPLTLKLFILAVLLLVVRSGSSQNVNNDTLLQNRDAVYGLIKRTMPYYADQFTIEFIGKKDHKDIFEIEAQNNKIVLRGNNGISIASALNYYLKNIVHCDITWNGTNLILPKVLPLPDTLIRKTTPYRFRYYLNYCTYNYSMSWWDWKRWEKEIDWMALNGINTPLALTGQNSIWDRVYKSMGFDDKDMESFFSGPAYFGWFWMGNLDAWGGPLPKSWMTSHEDLQKKILERERSFGMTPVLPAFTGHVPPSFKNKFPNAKLKKTSWVGFPKVSILDPSDPMFTEIGKRFITEQTKIYGTDHLYSADTFNENTPPSNDTTFLSEVSKKVYQSMAMADPKAKWFMQGWLFYHESKFWKEKQIKALLNAVPDDKMIILDLWSERFPIWNSTKAYYGKPWIWNMLHNFGGNINLYGLMENIANNPSAALHSQTSGKLSGIGLTMEGIEQNPVIYELMLENVWRDQPIDLSTWLKDYTLRRYGNLNGNAVKAWNILRTTVYADSMTSGGPESIIAARPTFNRNANCVTTRFTYKQKDLINAWEYMLKASESLKSSDGYQFDLVDITRQVMANYATVIQERFGEDYKRQDLNAFKLNSDQFLELITDMDRLLATRKDFLLGTWLNSAKACGTNNDERTLYEKNARNLLTLWGDKNSRLHEYANRQWSGLLEGFYKKRWEQFFTFIETNMQNKKDVDFEAYEESIKDWEWEWVNSHESYTDQPQGDAVKVANEMFRKYHDKMIQSYKDESKSVYSGAKDILP